MSDIVWRRVRAGEYESEAGRIVRQHYNAWGVHPNSPIGPFATGTLKLGKMLCERAWNRAGRPMPDLAACEAAYRKRLAATEGER